MARRTPYPGFTLIELLVIISILTLLIAMLVPSLGAAKEAARRVKCLSNQRQTGLAVVAYAEASRGVVPTWTKTSYGTMSPDGYVWSEEALVKPLFGNDINPASVMNCPSYPVSNPIKLVIFAYPSKPVEWLSSQMFLAGMADVQLSTVGIWYDTIPSAPPLNIATVANPADSIIVTDRNVFQSMGSNFGWSNHTRTSSITGLSNFQSMIVGGNRLHLDLHGTWVGREVMGKNGTPIEAAITSARFNALGKYGEARVCYW